MEIRFLKRQLTAAYQYSFTRLTLNYYTFFETMSETVDVSGRMEEYSRAFQDILRRYLHGENVEEHLHDLRAKTTREVEILTAYTDCFQIYEYVLNRLERRFVKKKATGYHDETYASMLIKFITSAKESAVMNTRIKEVISQLPVRLTKKKFQSLVLDGLNVYIGASRDNLQDMMYTLRTESMVELPREMEEDHKAYYETLEQFRHADYRNMTADAYEEASAKLAAVSADLMDEAGLYVMLQDIINDLYVLHLAKEDSVSDVKEEELYRSILEAVLGRFEREDYSVMDEAVTAKLQALEGRQETYYERYMRSELPKETAELNQDPDYIRAVNIDRLLSGSSFADLKELPAGPQESGGTADKDGAYEDALTDQGDTASDEEFTVDRAYLEQTAGAYFEELDGVFADASRPVVRAVMAKVLSDLPVYFRSVDEISAYIQNSLESCDDEDEKETCKELLEELMDYEDSLV